MTQIQAETVSEKLDKAVKAAKGKISRGLTPDEMPKATQAVLNLAQAKSMYESCRSAKEVDEELMVVLDRIRPNLGPTDMMKSTQAVLNLMYVKAQLDSVARSKAEQAKQSAKAPKAKAN